jgi:hypothetical protein
VLFQDLWDWTVCTLFTYSEHLSSKLSDCVEDCINVSHFGCCTKGTLLEFEPMAGLLGSANLPHAGFAAAKACQQNRQLWPTAAVAVSSSTVTRRIRKPEGRVKTPSPSGVACGSSSVTRLCRRTANGSRAAGAVAAEASSSSSSNYQIKP